jgi:peptidoglycan L-alanyl-D-glutamate endopeptidase CwlK
VPKFSQKSLAQLETCHADLQLLFARVVEEWDCKIETGHRGQRAQNAAYAHGKSKLEWPRSKHNSRPSMAVDVYAYPVDVKNRTRQVFFAGYVLGVAASLYANGEMTHRIRSGSDFNQDRNTEDDGWDCWHFELIKREATP